MTYLSTEEDIGAFEEDAISEEDALLARDEMPNKEDDAVLNSEGGHNV